ncbi:hypothetical protein ILYODFUR_033726 [Ilyodon furcidens]|uniref:Uncharacterized protein n=1 Tax=Ilyodon furcidens TaxID=33524 RepID=A0ABV0VJB4_9TELE
MEETNCLDLWRHWETIFLESANLAIPVSEWFVCKPLLNPVPVPVPEELGDERPPHLLPVPEGFEDEPPFLPVPEFREGVRTQRLRRSSRLLQGLVMGSNGFCTALLNSTVSFLMADLLIGSEGPLHADAGFLTCFVVGVSGSRKPASSLPASGKPAPGRQG